jgi:hypothetical protein
MKRLKGDIQTVRTTPQDTIIHTHIVSADIIAMIPHSTDEKVAEILRINNFRIGANCNQREFIVKYLRRHPGYYLVPTHGRNVNW